VETNKYNLEIRIRGGKLALDDLDVLQHIDTETLDPDERRVVELVEDDRVEITESSFRDGPCRVYRFRTEDTEVAKKYGFEVEETRYLKYINVSADLEGADRNSVLAFRLQDLVKDITMAITLLATPKVELTDVDWDKRGGWTLIFETTHEGAAKAYGFEEMLLPGEEDYEPTPWAAEQNGEVQS